MVMLSAGTFDYVAVVPAEAADGIFECIVESRHLDPITGRDELDSRLVGLAPKLAVTEGGLTPDAVAGRPSVMRSRLTLTATSKNQASVAEASFHVDRALGRRMLPGDTIYMGRTQCAGLGLSVVRQGELVVAVGVVHAVPLGHLVKARYPYELIEEAEAIFQRRDPEFEFPERPLEVIVDGASRIVGSNFVELGAYQVFVAHGFIADIPGIEVCAAIWRKDLCPSLAARASAELIDHRERDPIEMIRW